jgi:hypothetical protein
VADNCPLRIRQVPPVVVVPAGVRYLREAPHARKVICNGARNLNCAKDQAGDCRFEGQCLPDAFRFRRDRPPQRGFRPLICVPIAGQNSVQQGTLALDTTRHALFLDKSFRQP